jgi:hypothetical protein
MFIPVHDHFLTPGFAALVSIEEEFASQDLQCLHQLPPGSLRSGAFCGAEPTGIASRWEK